MRGWVNNYPHSVCGIYRYEFKKENHHFSTWSLFLPIHFVHLSTSFFFQSQNSVYIFFSEYFFLEACAHDLRLAPSESTTTQALNAARVRSHEAPILNCFDSCSIGVLMGSYIHAHEYVTSICDLLLFLIAKWSQSLVTIFIQAPSWSFRLETFWLLIFFFKFLIFVIQNLPRICQLSTWKCRKIMYVQCTECIQNQNLSVNSVIGYVVR